jgi:hypothetical protein
MSCHGRRTWPTRRASSLGTNRRVDQTKKTTGSEEAGSPPRELRALNAPGLVCVVGPRGDTPACPFGISRVATGASLTSLLQRQTPAAARAPVVMRPLERRERPGRASQRRDVHVLNDLRADRGDGWRGGVEGLSRPRRRGEARRSGPPLSSHGLPVWGDALGQTALGSPHQGGTDRARVRFPLAHVGFVADSVAADESYCTRCDRVLGLLASRALVRLVNGASNRLLSVGGADEVPAR